MLRPRWLAQAVVFGILCLGGAGLAVGLAQIHDNVFQHYIRGADIWGFLDLCFRHADHRELASAA